MTFREKLLENKRSLLISIAILLSVSIFTLIKHHTHHNYIKQQIELPKDFLAETTDENGLTADGWLTIRSKNGDTLGKIFQKINLSQTILQDILRNNPHAKLLTRIMPNQEIRFKIENKQLKQMIFPVDSLKFITVEETKNGFKTNIQTRSMTERREYISTTVRSSLYQTAKLANIPTKLIDQMNQIFYWQVQLNREIHPGDRLNISYQAFYINDERVKIGDILAVSYRHANGVTYEAVRHENKNGEISYYKPNGASLKKAFTRYPIHFSHISSSFGSSRNHPILHYRRAHKGIDLAAPIGTPIYSIGDGRISFLGKQNGYGNMIKINHDSQYSTIYAHLLRFQKGLHNGSAVKRGQLIGFVGQSGLATGPHCHFEFHVHHVPRNPATVALPQASPIPRSEAYAFFQNTKQLFAQLKLYEDSQLASMSGAGNDVLS